MELIEIKKLDFEKGGLVKEEEIACPLGGVIAWLKSFTGTPALPSVFVECNGQLISDSESPFDGQTIPDLNGAASEPTVNYFLRGNTTSGGTGGSSTHTLTIPELPVHNHTLPYGQQIGFPPAGVKVGNVEAFLPTKITSSSTGGGAAHENKPPYYDVVWIMRIK